MRISPITQLLAHARVATGDELPPGLVFDEDTSKFVVGPEITPPPPKTEEN